MNETIQLIKNHRSIRNFLDQPIENQVIDEILRAAQAKQQYTHFCGHAL